jgi:hypothetical protein
LPLLRHGGTCKRPCRDEGDGNHPFHLSLHVFSAVRMQHSANRFRTNPKSSGDEQTLDLTPAQPHRVVTSPLWF